MLYGSQDWKTIHLGKHLPENSLVHKIGKLSTWVKTFRKMLSGSYDWKTFNLGKNLRENALWFTRLVNFSPV
jgi:hypothetical protein